MADYGLLGGLAEGLKSGFDSYRDTKRANQELELKKRQMGADLMARGLKVDENTGEIVKDDLAKAKQDYELAAYDPESTQSQAARKQAAGLLSSAGADASFVPDTAAAKDITGENSLYGKAITGAYGMQGRQIVGDRANARNNLIQQGLDLRRSKMGQEAGQSIEKDPIVQNLKKTTNSLDRASSMLDGKEPITTKSFAILQQDMINAMAPGGAATEGKVNREMVETFAGHLNDLQLKFGNVKDLRKDQPEVFNQLRNQIKAIRDDYKKAQANQVNDIASSYKYSGIPQVQKTIGDKQSRYSLPDEDAHGLIPSQGLLQGSAPQIPEADKQDMLKEIQKNPSSPAALHFKQLLGIK